MDLPITQILYLFLLHLDVSISIRCEGIQNPSLGDLCLNSDSEDQASDSGTVFIFYTDNFHKPRWGTICDSLVNPNTRTVMCHQLGYVSANLEKSGFWTRKNLPPPWLSSVQCKNSSVKHILRCDPHIATPPECSGSATPTYLSCKPPWNRPPSGNEDSARYNGQVWLLHPNHTTQQGQQVSYGLVYIRLNNQWGTIYMQQSSPLGSYAADALCIQLGYTQADPLSITTMQLSNNSFLLPRNEVVDNSWLLTNETTQCSTLQSCFTCCFSQPSKMCDTTINHCPQTNSVVLRCLFDPHKKPLPPEGNQQLCEFSSNHSPSICDGPSILYETLTYSFVGVIFILAIISITSTICVIYLKCKLRNPPEPAPERQPFNPQQADGDHN